MGLNCITVTVIVTFLFLSLCGEEVQGQCSAIANGGYVKKNVDIQLGESPCTVTQTVVIAKGFTLRIDPGVEMRFGPGVMLAVNGTLIARVC